jgi:acylphosphatase
MNNIRKTVTYGGTVQGVGFRYTVVNLAQKRDVTGYVRNLADGRVELVAEGAVSEIDALLDEIKISMKEYIEKIEVNETTAAGIFTSFGIRRQG